MVFFCKKKRKKRKKKKVDVLLIFFTPLTKKNARPRRSTPVTISDIPEQQPGRYTATLKGFIYDSASVCNGNAHSQPATADISLGDAKLSRKRDGANQPD